MTNRRIFVSIKRHFTSAGADVKDATFLTNYKIGRIDDAGLYKRFTGRIIYRDLYDDIDDYYYRTPAGIILNNGLIIYLR